MIFVSRGLAGDVMKIAFSSEENNGLKSMISHHFGRCPYYVIVEIDDKTKEIKSVKTLKNPYFEEHKPGVVPKFIKEKGASVIIAGGMGPRAMEIFKAFGIKVVTGRTGVVEEVLNDYLNNT